MSEATRTALPTLVESTRGPQPWRRIFHATSGVAMAAALSYLAPPRALTTGLLLTILVLAILVDAIRLALPRCNVLFFRIFRHLASPREAGRAASSTWYLAGVLLVFLLFPLDAAVPAILVLALADPAASLLGRRFGRRKLGTGSVEGSLVFVGVALAVLVPLVPPAAAMLAAIGAAVVEVIPWKLDDNLTIPLAAASLLSLAGAAG